ncbi:DMT family transporter [Sneathiella glossodoripedis]|uniref:DMT family transporter n=1 Tax=Sneathiella glossodoripedis TaxID=418853 RepID=UPI00046FEED5|nr:DMT family transporter [Sneathiella glossodoripedis]
MQAGPVNNLKGAILLTLAAVVFTGEVIAVRFLGTSASDGQIVFARAFVQFAMVALWILLTSPHLIKTSRPGLHIIRGITSLICWFFYYKSFQLLDMALATTLTFTTSLIVVALAAPLLKEAVSARRWFYTALGFIGVAIASNVIGSSSTQFDFSIAFGLLAAIAAAALVFQNRVLSKTEHTATIMFYIGLITTVGATPGLLLDHQPLQGNALLLLLISGCLGTIGMILTVEAYRVAEVSAMAPFPYLRIVFAILAGLFLFGESPTWQTMLGSG